MKFLIVASLAVLLISQVCCVEEIGDRAIFESEAEWRVNVLKRIEFCLLNLGLSLGMGGEDDSRAEQFKEVFEELQSLKLKAKAGVYIVFIESVLSDIVYGVMNHQSHAHKCVVKGVKIGQRKYQDVGPFDCSYALTREAEMFDV